MIASSANLLYVLVSLTLGLAVSVSGEDDVYCPLDYELLPFSNDNGENSSQRRKLRQQERERVLQHNDGGTSAPPIEVIAQGGNYVDFIVHNSTAFGLVPDHLFVQYPAGDFREERCPMYEGLGPVDSPSSPSATAVQRASCVANTYAIVWIYARSVTTPGQGTATIPKCCHDPYTTDIDIPDDANANTVSFAYEVKCVPTCDNPVRRVPPTAVPTASPVAPTAAPTAVPTASPTVRVSRRSLQEEIIKDMMPPSSGKCSGNNAVNSTYAFESSQAESQWNDAFVDYEEDLFLAKMQHTDNNANRSWTIRFGQAGNIYSMVGPMGETVPPQDHDKAPWVDEVWQAVQPLGSGGDNDNNPNTDKYFIHEAGVYQKDAPYTSKPFYSPTLGNYCNDEDGECGFASWGQQAHVETPWKSPLLYLNRYVNCGNGVFEYTTLRHNIVGSSDTFGYLNVPWGGTRRSVLGDVVITNKSTQEQKVVYPLNGWGDGVNTPLKETMGYTIFAEDLPKNANPLHDQPYTDLPSGLDLTIGSQCFCEGNCRKATNRYVCPLTSDPGIGWSPNRGDPGLVVRLEGQGGKSVIAGVRHWAGNGKLYFYQSDLLTLSKIQEALTPGTTVKVFHYYPSNLGKREEDNLALAHVHGGSNGSGNYPRVRYGAAGRDYNVYTINDIPTIEPGSTYYYRQYFMMDAYTEMRSKGAHWAPEAVKATKTVGAIAGRKVTLYKSDSAGTTFGHAIAGDTCRHGGSTPVCEGKSTPQANWKPLFEVHCGDSYVVTHDLYYFSPPGTPYRSYVCNGMEDTTRPVWTLLGHFPVDSCGELALNYQYDSEYC